ncbi:MAG: aldehyde dehydrogenase family protein, partial [Alphaproteobacteria bacterium]|nr:aldehyde dehydrogenase family protein [Alphaproteobacteria bacterium]
MQLNNPSLFRSQCYINGEWVDADSGSTFEVSNPANAEVLGTVPMMGANETRRAIEAADAAWPAWRALTGKNRAQILRRWYDLMHENLDDLGMIMTLEQGKPLAEAKGEIHYASWFVEWFAEEGKRAYGEVIPATLPDRRIVTTKEPIG